MYHECVRSTTEVWNGTLRLKKKKDPTPMTAPQEKDDICTRRQITPQGIYVHYREKSFQKQVTSCVYYGYYGYDLFEKQTSPVGNRSR